jgi:transketolase
MKIAHRCAQCDAGASGIILGMRTFEMSAPTEVVAEQFGFTTGAVTRWATGATH